MNNNFEPGVVSIIIPTYQMENFIEKTILSVLKQSWKKWEMLIIDDGSRDNTRLVIEKYLSDSRIHYFHQENSGVSLARNSGLTKSKGEFISFLDSDDLWTEKNLEEKVKIFNTDPEIDFVFSDIRYINEEDKETGQGEQGADQNMLAKYLEWSGAVIPALASNLVIRRSAVIKHELKFDQNLSTAADQDFGIHVSRYSKGKRIPEPLVLYRRRNASMSMNISVMERDHILVFRKAVSEKIFHSTPYKRKCFANLYLILAGSWWKNGNRKLRGITFLVKAFLQHPPSIFSKLARTIS